MHVYVLDRQLARERLLIRLIAYPLLLLGLWLLGAAFASTAGEARLDQAAPALPGLPMPNVAAWGASVILYATVVSSIVAFVNQRVRRLYGWRTVALAFAVSELGAFLLFTRRQLTDPNFQQLGAPLQWIVFGLVGGFVATGGVNLLRQLLSGQGAPAVDKASRPIPEGSAAGPPRPERPTDSPGLIPAPSLQQASPGDYPLLSGGYDPSEHTSSEGPRLGSPTATSLGDRAATADAVATEGTQP